MWHAFVAFNATVSRWCMYIAVAGLMDIVATVALQVFGRYVLNDTPTCAESTALVLILYVTMLGATVGVRDAGHIGLESLLVLVSGGLPLKLEVVIHALVGSFGLIMAWNGAVLAESVMGYKIPTLGLSEGINHLPLVIGGISVGQVMRTILPFYGALIAALFLVTYVPAFSLALPKLFLGKF